MNISIKKEILQFLQIVKNLNKKVVTVLLLIPVLQTISYYYTSPQFFRTNFYQMFSQSKFADLYEYYYWFLGDFSVLFIIPLLVIILYLKERPKNYGIKIGNYKFGIQVSLVFLLIMIPIIWLSSASNQFASQYPYLKSTNENWNIFIIYEIGILLYLFAWEFIWRGFMLFGLEEKFGYYAVLIQMIPFVILHNGKPSIETFGAIIGGIVLGVLALRTRSYLYGVFLHFGVMFSIDFISVLRFRAGDYGRGFTSLLHIIGNLF